MLISCTSCSSKIRVPDSAAGKRVKCPKCATIIRVPASETAAADPESAAVAKTPMPPPPTVKPDDPPDDKSAEPDEPAPAESFSTAPISSGKKPPPVKGSRDDGDDEDEDDDDPAPRKKRRGYDDDDEDDDDVDDFDVRKGRSLRKQPINGMAMTSMITGITSVSMLVVMICCCGLVGAGITATLSGGLALVFGFMGKTPGSEGYAMTGIICGAVAVVLGLLELVIGAIVIGFHFAMLG